MMSPAGSEHGALTIQIGRILANFVMPRGLGAVLGGDAGFLIAQNPDTVRAPDVAFLRAERVGERLPKGFFAGAPDLAVEVLSPGGVLEKVQDWLAAGCLAVWVVDPKKQTVTIYDNRHTVVRLRSTDTLSGGDLLPGFSVPVAEFFAI
jgi:Uma2 family endonuclease